MTDKLAELFAETAGARTRRDRARLRRAAYRSGAAGAGEMRRAS